MNGTDSCEELSNDEPHTNFECSSSYVAAEPTNNDVMEELEKPYVGLKFPSESDLIRFYNSYAMSSGFSIRKGKLRRSERTGLPIGRRIVCSKEGYKDMKDKRYQGREVKRRPDIREGCEANIVASVDEEGSWVVRHFHDIHNHVLASPSKVKKLRSHRHISSATRGLIDTLHSCGLGAAKISSVLSASGEQNITNQICTDQIKSSRKNNIGHECMGVVRCFEEKMTTDKDFFFKLEVDESMTVRSIFWADGRSRLSYFHFGDVLVFDTTYRTNRFLMPFAPFTGVNHHRQSTLFGCALLADESTKTFTWLFRTWLQCMGGKMPTAIITDQDPAMREAIASVFPSTTHRFCIWHIKKNALIHLHQLRCNIEFEGDYNKWVYGSRTTEEFEHRWETLRLKYSIGDNSWLSNMYKLRNMWIPVCLKDVFCAGISSTQRSEGMNAFFNGFVHSHTPISEFILQYERALNARREAKQTQDFKAMNSKPALWSEHPMVAQGASFYTPANFKLFQEEFKKSINSGCNKISKDVAVVTYEVFLNSVENHKFVVTFWPKELKASCSCKKFPSEGIPCSHILTVFRKKGLNQVPREYLLSRWSMEYRFVGAARENTLEIRDKPTLNVLWGLRSLHAEIYECVSLDAGNLKVAMGDAEETLRKIKELQLKKLIQPSTVEEAPFDVGILAGDVHLPTANVEVPSIPDPIVAHLEIRDPACAKAKGRPRKSERMKSCLEASTSQVEKKQKTCGYCGEKGHYRTGCKKLKDEVAKGKQVQGG